MRVLYFSRSFTTHDLRFVRSMVAHGLSVAYLRLEDDGIRYLSDELPAGAEWVTWAGGRTRVRSPADLTALLPAYHEVIDRLRPDLVHAGPVQSCGLLASLVGGCPIVVMSWGSDVLVEAERDAWSRWATRTALSRCDAFACDSQAVLACARTYAKLVENRTVVFPWGLEQVRQPVGDPGGRAKLRASLGWGDAVVLVATRVWLPGYGVDQIVSGLARAAQAEPRLRLLLAGTGPEETRIHQLLRDADLEDRVHCPGMLPQKELHRWQAAADGYVCATPSDGTSISLLEAMWHSLPVIVVDNPGNREWVRDGQEGWLVSAGDVGALADRMLALAAEPARARSMGARGRAVVLERADWERNFPRLIALYRWLAPSDGSGRAEPR